MQLRDYVSEHMRAPYPSDAYVVTKPSPKMARDLHLPPLFAPDSMNRADVLMLWPASLGGAGSEDGVWLAVGRADRQGGWMRCGAACHREHHSRAMSPALASALVAKASALPAAPGGTVLTLVLLPGSRTAARRQCCTTTSRTTSIASFRCVTHTPRCARGDLSKQGDLSAPDGRAVEEGDLVS